MHLTESLDFQNAFRRVDSDKRDDAWLDVVGYRDYKRELTENVRVLQAKVQRSNQYSTDPPFVIDLPKRGFMLRPGIVPAIDDRVVYQSIVDMLTPHFASESSVYSNRLAGSDTDHMFVQGVELWLAFQYKVEEYCQSYRYVVETDVTAYFDHINHDLLLSRITDLFGTSVDKDVLKDAKIILRRLWGRWNIGYLRNFGIPQLNDASSFMGNLFLDELDKWLMARNIVYLRYVDDIRIFADSEALARKYLADLIVKMREMGLYVASGKTNIRPTEAVLDGLIQGRRQVREIEADIDSADPSRMERAARNLGDFFRQLVSDPQEFDDRLFRFCVNRFKRLYVTGLGLDTSREVIAEVLQRLSSMPESTNIFVDYLSLFGDDEFVQMTVMDFLEGPYNIYPWQEMQLLELLIRQDLSPKARLRAIQYSSRVESRNWHPACKSRAYILRGKIGTYADRRDVRSGYDREDREDVRRSIVVAVQEMRPDERNNFYKTIAEGSRGVKQLVDYVQSLARPTYHYFNPPSPYEIDVQTHDSDDLHDLGSEYFM